MLVLESFEIRQRRCPISTARESHISIKEEQERLKISREPIERLTNLTSVYMYLRVSIGD